MTKVDQLREPIVGDEISKCGASLPPKMELWDALVPLGVKKRDDGDLMAAIKNAQCPQCVKRRAAMSANVRRWRKKKRREKEKAKNG